MIIKFRDALRWLSLLLLVSASIANAKDMDCSIRANALEVSNGFIAKHMPDELQPNYPKPVLTDMGAEWKVAYGLPDGMTGGAPTVFIDKKTCKVAKAISGQ